ncbi:MAG: DNA repair protein RecO [Gammaproteobacteria bacterium]|nr:DNA repair protein RecO [Gammaproteobacteria bacterium]
MNQQSHRVSLEPAFILHGRDFRDSSRLLDVFTKEFGRVTLVAKGARSARSKLQGILQPFTPLVISWSGKGDVQTLTGAESVKSTIHLSGKQVMSGYYINELMQRLTTFHDPHPELFTLYQGTLESFAVEEDEIILRRFEKHLLSEIGYGLNLLTETDSGRAVNPDDSYFYDIEKGPLSCNKNNSEGELVISGQTLVELNDEKFSCVQTQREAKQLMRIILSHHLGDKPLKTRSLHWYKPL